MLVCGPIHVPFNRKSRSFWLRAQFYASPSKKRRAACEIFLGEWGNNAFAARLREFIS
jgi:hypothetical protein